MIFTSIFKFQYCNVTIHAMLLSMLTIETWKQEIIQISEIEVVRPGFEPWTPCPASQELNTLPSPLSNRTLQIYNI